MTRTLAVFALFAGLLTAQVPVKLDVLNMAQQKPRKAAELAIQLLDGKQVLLSSYRGKIVLVTFISTT